MQKEEISNYIEEAESHLVTELLPFWTTRMIDYENVAIQFAVLR